MSDHVAFASLVSPAATDTDKVTNVVLGTLNGNQSRGWKARFEGACARVQGARFHVVIMPLVPHTVGQAIDKLLNAAKSVGLIPSDAVSGRYDAPIPKPPLEGSSHIIRVSLLDPAPGRYRLSLLNAYGSAARDKSEAHGFVSEVARINSDRLKARGIHIHAEAVALEDAGSPETAAARMVKLATEATTKHVTAQPTAQAAIVA